MSFLFPFIEKSEISCIVSVELLNSELVYWCCCIGVVVPMLVY